tara:strand:- start:4364 stop:4852 length:489 start_codon:yes stop_codon:yes gene_type:complete
MKPTPIEKICNVPMSLRYSHEDNIIALVVKHLNKEADNHRNESHCDCCETFELVDMWTNHWSEYDYDGGEDDFCSQTCFMFQCPVCSIEFGSTPHEIEEIKENYYLSKMANMSNYQRLITQVAVLENELRKQFGDSYVRDFYDLGYREQSFTQFELIRRGYR